MKKNEHNKYPRVEEGFLKPPPIPKPHTYINIPNPGFSRSHVYMASPAEMNFLFDNQDIISKRL